MRWRNLLPGLVLVLTALIPLAAPCQPSAATTKRQVADLIHRAVSLQQGGDHAAAITLFAEGYALHPDPVILFLKARSHLALSQFGEARDLYVAVRRFPDKVGPTNMLELERNLTRCNEELKETLVHVTTPGIADASILIDGRFVGSSPLNLSLKKGDYTLRAEKEGFDTTEVPLHVEGTDEQAFEVSLKVHLATEAVPTVAVQSTAWPPRRSGPSRTTWAWIATGAGAVVLGTGLGFLGDYGVKQGRSIDPNQHWEGTTATLAVGGTLTAVGLALATTSVVLFVTDHPEAEDGADTLSVTPLPGGCGIAFQGGW